MSIARMVTLLLANMLIISGSPNSAHTWVIWLFKLSSLTIKRKLKCQNLMSVFFVSNYIINCLKFKMFFTMPDSLFVKKNRCFALKRCSFGGWCLQQFYTFEIQAPFLFNLFFKHQKPNIIETDVIPIWQK